MNLLEFFASVIGSIAWPLALLLVTYWLREPIANLLPLLQRLKYKDVELEFDKRVEKISADVAQELPPPASENTSPISELAAIAKIADTSPRAAVLEAWSMVEQSVYEAAQSLGWEAPSGKVAKGTFAMRFLSRQPAIDPARIDLLQDLRELRNRAAHAPELALSKSTAMEYASNAVRVARYLHTVALANDLTR